MTETGATNGPWRAVAPGIFALIDAIEDRARRSIDATTLDPVRSAVVAVLVPAPERAAVMDRNVAPSAPASDGSAACVAFAEQFVVDVAGTTEEQRAAMSAVMGADAFTFVQALYVTDVFLRLRIGLARLFARAIPVAAAPALDPDRRSNGGPVDDLWTLLERFMAQVARLDALDPLTSELVRLTGAQVHDCRLCRSRRSVRALDVAGGASLLDSVARDGGGGDEVAGLDERQGVALRLTDALVTQPASIDAALVGEVHEWFSTDEVVELVLDVARNAANKIAVAFAADAPVVADGVEYYDLDGTGEVIADADIAVVRNATAR